MVTWVPPAPIHTGTPMLFVESLLPEANYVVEASTDFRDWQPLFGLPTQDFERSSDRKSLFVRDLEAREVNLNRRFYRVRKSD